jgi:creatinine amidohydrolase
MKEGYAVNLSESTWVQARDLLAHSDLLIVPLGATEVYGPHLPTGSETIIGDYVGKLLGERVNALVAPTLPVTCSGNLDYFPGNLYISPDTLKSMLRDICARATRWGIKRVFFLNVHGPNMAVVEEISRELLAQGVRCAQIDFWRFMLRLSEGQLRGKDLPAGHSSEMAASTILAIRPELVQPQHYATSLPDPGLSEKYPDVMTYARWNEVTPTGYTCDPSQASKEAGEVMLVRVIDRLEQFLADWR